MSRIDMTGHRSGRLTVIQHAGTNRDRKATWLCRCDCGTEVTVAGRDLRKGHTQSCGCLKRDLASQRSMANLAGQRYGRLEAIERIGTAPDGKAVWDCLCDCGSRVSVKSGNLRSGNTTSCGCYRREQISLKKSKPIVTYTSAHFRIRRARGPASKYTCVDCHARACQWSYSHSDPSEVKELVSDTRNGVSKPRWVAYSLDPDFYEPRCISCHVQFDVTHARLANQKETA